MIGHVALGHMMGGIRPFGGPGLLGFALLLAVTAIVVALVMWAITRPNDAQRQPAAAVAASHTPSGSPAPPASDAARQIARERLARGDIDPEQYRVIIDALNTL